MGILYKLGNEINFNLHEGEFASVYREDIVLKELEKLEEHKKIINEMIDKVLASGYEKLNIIRENIRVYVLVRSWSRLGKDRKFDLYYCNKHMVDTSWFQYGEHVESKEFKGRNLDNQKEKYLEYLNRKYEIYKVIND